MCNNTKEKLTKKKTYGLVADWYQPSPIKKILDPPLIAVSEVSLFIVEMDQSNYHYI